jgi:RNA recognition motif-containing protein
MRLYVGGLPPDVREEELRARFTPFGVVTSCEIMPSKDPQAPSGVSRGMAYVELTPKDETSIARCLSLVRSSCMHETHY